jgi:glycosyltransferase involved in cell wall biosynthesis
MPLVILEAMAAGKAVISTQDVGAIPEVVRHGETGLLVEKQNPKALASAILRLIEDPAFRKRLGRAARQRFEERYTIDKSIYCLTQVFEKALDGCRSGVEL